MSFILPYIPLFIVFDEGKHFRDAFSLPSGLTYLPSGGERGKEGSS